MLNTKLNQIPKCNLGNGLSEIKHKITNDLFKIDIQHWHYSLKKKRKCFLNKIFILTLTEQCPKNYFIKESDLKSTRTGVPMKKALFFKTVGKKASDITVTSHV